MRQENPIRDAIDESLCGVRFDTQDMQSVLCAVQRGGRQSARKPRRAFRPALAFGLIALIVTPLAVLSLRIRGPQLTSVAAPTGILVTPSNTAAKNGGIGAGDAVRIARICYEETCDTEIFTFDEFTVHTAYASAQDDAPGGTYTVALQSIYGNGCTFTVVIDAATGAILSTSDPERATVPDAWQPDSAHMQSWIDKNGPLLLTWPQDEQAEFSRRYQGGMLRAAREGEISRAQAEKAAATAAKDAFAALGFSGEPFCYATLESERAGVYGTARYVVYCFPSPLVSSLADATEPCIIVTLGAQDGAVESVIEGGVPSSLLLGK